MEIIQIIGIGLIALVLIVIIKQYRPEFAIYISLIVGVIILFFILDEIMEIINILTSIGETSGIKFEYILILIKLTGIAYLSEYAMSICNDSGETAIASKIELGTKVLMVYLSIPIILVLLETIKNIL